MHDPVTAAIARVDASRLHPTTCLYCAAAATGDEHVLGEAVGGRLTATIICGHHNGEAASTADAPLAEHYATLTWAARVRRQRGNSAGKIGTSVRYINADGRRTTVGPDGHSEHALEAERNDAGIIQRASGPLGELQHIARRHPDPNGFRLFEVAGDGANIPIEVGIGPESLPGYAKAALHFAAGFVAAPSPATIAALAPGIFRQRPARVLLQLPFRQPFFDPTGPIRHEITLYPDGPDAVVTIMLFSSFNVTIALPHFATRIARRYIQLLDGTGPQLVNVEPIPIPRESLSEREWDDLITVSHANIERILRDRQQFDLEEICQTAARIAFGNAARVDAPFSFIEYFRAELERVPLQPPERITDVVRQAERHLSEGREPLDFTPMVLR